jgi:hypothetical protein
VLYAQAVLDTAPWDEEAADDKQPSIMASATDDLDARAATPAVIAATLAATASAARLIR